MKKIVDRCLEKDPENRYSTVSRLQLDLLNIKDSTDSTTNKDNQHEIKNKFYEHALVNPLEENKPKKPSIIFSKPLPISVP